MNAQGTESNLYELLGRKQEALEKAVANFNALQNEYRKVFAVLQRVKSGEIEIDQVELDEKTLYYKVNQKTEDPKGEKK